MGFGDLPDIYERYRHDDRDNMIGMQGNFMNRRLAMSIALGLCAPALFISNAASAGVDVTPPSLTVPEHASFPVGRQVPSLDWPGKFPVHYAWNASDDSGICSAAVLEHWGDGYIDKFRIWRGKDSEVDLDVVQSNGSHSDNVQYHSIRVKDCAGNKATRTFPGIPLVFEEQGYAEEIVNETPANVSWHGNWRLHTEDTAYGGSLATTKDPGAKVVYAFDAATSNLEAGSHIGLVMPVGPHRGKVTVSLFGSEDTVVDTYAPQRQPRQVVADIEVSADNINNNKVTLTLTNFGGGAKSKVSIDAIAIL